MLRRAWPLPGGIAYPAIAGLAPVVGLYASILPLVGYAIFGSSRQLIVGPDAATPTILAASLSQVPMTGSEPQRAVASAAFAIAVGLMCLLSGAFRLGFIANFLSRPILTGYLCGISLALLTSQIGRLTTVSVEAKGVLRPLIALGGWGTDRGSRSGSYDRTHNFAIRHIHPPFTNLYQGGGE
jgi:sulfate permease, SulP family